MNTKDSQKIDLVTRQFKDQLGLYTKIRAEGESKILPMLEKYIDEHLEQEKGSKPALVSVCEFGGGGGFMLAQIHQFLGDKVKLINAELVDDYRGEQAIPEIQFHNTSILKSEFEDSSFDVVIIRNVLHHLVGDTFTASRKNQELAFRELVRVLKPSGVALIQEQTIPSYFSCWLIYYLSLLASKLKFNIPFFQITPNTVVGYVHPHQVVSMAEKSVKNKALVSKEYIPRSVSLRWKLTLLLRKTGDLYLSIRKT